MNVDPFILYLHNVHIKYFIITDFAKMSRFVLILNILTLINQEKNIIYIHYFRVSQEIKIF